MYVNVFVSILVILNKIILNSPNTMSNIKPVCWCITFLLFNFNVKYEQPIARGNNLNAVVTTNN